MMYAFRFAINHVSENFFWYKPEIGTLTYTVCYAHSQFEVKYD